MRFLLGLALAAAALVLWNVQGGAEINVRDLPASETAAVTAGPTPLPNTVPSVEQTTERRVPSYLIQLPERAPTALVVDLLANQLFVFERGGALPVKRSNYYVAIGKNGSDKMREGDEKTPVGIYYVSSYLPDERLPEIYGVGAFPISYPNRWDRLLGRTGSGIWIHGTDKEPGELPPRSSRGCLTLANSDFEDLRRQVRVGVTPVIASNRVEWVSPRVVEELRQSISAAVEQWRRDWESIDTERYLIHYAPDFHSPNKDFDTWRRHKHRVNAAKTFVEVEIHDVAIYRYPDDDDLMLVAFDQTYRSDNFNSQVFKHQYWRRDNGTWRIVYEGGV